MDSLRIRRALGACSLTLAMTLVPITAGAQTAAGEKDALRATLLESKEKNKGVNLYAKGASVAMIVTAVEERYVIGRNQQASRIVFRIDQIDGVSAAF